MKISVLLIAMTLILSACNGGGGGGGSKSKAKPSDVATISLAESESDTNALMQAEKDLKKVGLAFKEVTKDGKAGVQWDPTVFNAFYDANPFIESDIRVALEDFIKITKKYIAKYSKPFVTTNDKGERETKVLIESAKALMEAKIGLGQSTITSLGKKGKIQ